MQHYQTPIQPYNVSEYGDWEYYAQNAGLNQQSWADLKDDERTSRQLLGAGEKRLLQQAMNLQEAHNDNLHTPAFADGYWVMFDYNRGYANDLEASGIMSIYRQPKFSYYLFQSQRDPALTSTQYNAGPMVYIASDWQADSSPNVRVFSNADAVELWLNGKLIARQTPDNGANTDKLPHPPFTFHLPRFEAGKLSAKAFIGNKLVATHSVSTPEAIHALEISLDTAGVPVNPTGSDVLFVNVRLVDTNGTTVPMNGKVVSFEADSAIEVLNPEAIVTEKGVATALVRVHNGAKGAHLRASFNLENAVTPLTAELKF
jgi:beta-galactosidase